MVEKRKRYVAVRESTQAKRRSISPTRATTPTPEVPTRSLTPDVPTSFTRDGPLPVLPKRQAESLLANEYKSVAESKVMAESLIRSQRKWVDGDIFEKFWTKPLKSRKLDPIELEKNPSKDCMVRIGNCTLSCKPHRFEIKLFGVLEPAKNPAPPALQPLQNPPVPTQPLPAPVAMAPRPQYTANNSQQHPPHLNPGSETIHVQQPVTYAPPSQSATAPALHPTQAPIMPLPQVSGPPGHVPAPTFVASALPPPGHHPQHPHHQQPVNSNMVQQGPHPGNPNMMQPGPPPRPDPVIQSLAVRAASDPELKALMRIVASGKATTEQLKIFQGHIDALTPASSPPIVPTVGRPRPLAPAQGSIGASVQTRPHAPSQQPPPQHPQQPQHLQHLHQQHLHHQQMIHHPQYVQYPQYSQQPQVQPHRPFQFSQPQSPAIQAPKPRPFPQPPKQEITSIVFEFLDPYSQGDRFVFPKYTILEYARGGTMVTASFMVTRKPIDDLDEYYQPITITLESPSNRTLEILQKVVADQETTCKHMKHLMETRKRAEDSFLVFRLRRDPNEVVPDKPEVHERMEAPLPQKAIRESRVRRDTSTPVRDSKGTLVDTPQLPPSRPRVKTVKKALPKEPPQVVPFSNNTNDPSTSTSALPITPIPRTPQPKQPKPPRSRKGRIADPTKSCSICKTSKTSLWRKADIEGENVTVCNACGIKWKTNAQRAAQVAAAAATGQPLPPSRENSSSGGQRPTMQQLTSGAPVMQFHPFPPEVSRFAAQNDGLAYPPAAGHPYPQSFDGYQAQSGSSSLPPPAQQAMMSQENDNSQHLATTAVPLFQSAPAGDKDGSRIATATSSIVASHVAAHLAQPSQPPQPPPQTTTAIPAPNDLGDGKVPT